MSDDLATVKRALGGMVGQFAARLPPSIKAERFAAAAFAGVARNTDLLNKNRDSLFLACLDAAEDGLLPDGREGALVPFGNKVSWMPMIGGLVKLAWNCGGLLSINADTAYRGETFTVRGGTEAGITHEYDLMKRGDRGSLEDVIASYAVAKTVGGGTMFAVLTPQEVAKVKGLSKGGRSDSPWNVWPVAMAEVRALRRLCKLLPLSNDRDADARMRQAAERGDVIDGVAEPMEEEQPRPAVEAPTGGKLEALERAQGFAPTIVTPREPEPATASPQPPAEPEQEQQAETPPQEWLDEADLFIGDIRQRKTTTDLDTFTKRPDVLKYRANVRARFPDLDAEIQAAQIRRYTQLRDKEAQE